MSSLNGLVTVTDELDRKTIEALTRIANEADLGFIDRYTGKVAVRSIFEAVSGLVSKPVSDALSDAMNCFNDVENIFFKTRRLFKGKNRFSMVLTDLDQNCYSVLKYENITKSISLKKYSFETKDELLTNVKARLVEEQQWSDTI